MASRICACERGTGGEWEAGIRLRADTALRRQPILLPMCESCLCFFIKRHWVLLGGSGAAA